MAISTAKSTITSDDVAPSATEARARISAVCLIGGAIALALGRALTNEGGSPAERLQQVSGHQAQIIASALLSMAGFAALIPGFLAVAARVQRRGARLATIGAGLTVLGCAVFEGMVALDEFPVVVATHSSSPAAMADLLHGLDDLPALLVLGPLAAIGYIVGPFLVSLAVKRSGRGPAWLPWGVLAALILQPIALGAFGGPGVAKHLLDTICQLVLVVTLVALARATLLAADRADR
jgi:hypothetical protein